MDGVLERIDEDEHLESSDEEHVTPIHNVSQNAQKIGEESKHSPIPDDRNNQSAYSGYTQPTRPQGKEQRIGEEE